MTNEFSFYFLSLSFGFFFAFQLPFYFLLCISAFIQHTSVYSVSSRQDFFKKIKYQQLQ